MESDFGKTMINDKEMTPLDLNDEAPKLEVKTPLNSDNPKPEAVAMKKSVGLASAVALIVGTMIGESFL